MFFWHSPLDFWKSWPIVSPGFGGIDFSGNIPLINVQGADARSIN
jgi:hypothetical protein